MKKERRRASRVDVESDVELVFDIETVFEGHGFDLSEIGIGFETDEPFPVSIVFRLEGQEYTRRGRIVRSQRGPDGKYRHGIEFTGDDY